MSLLASLLILNSLHGPLAARLPTPLLPADSIGQEIRGGQRFVRHRVAQGETLFALSRRYHVAVDQIEAANPQLKNGLGIGEVVLIPRGAGGSKAAASPAKPILPTPAAATIPERYTVAKGETLFGIARRFSLSPSELLLLNHLPAGGAVRVGQELLLRPAQAGPTPPVTTGLPAAPVPAAPEPSTPKADKSEAAAPKINPAREAQIATVTPATSAEKKEEAGEAKAPTRASELVGRKTDVGIAAPILNSSTDKYLALHKTAPIGTIMQVKNQMNGQSVYVRVIGTLPDTGENDNILVRLSPRAVQKLGTSDSKFRVETSYVP